jgi:4-amino-4-deoxy-L-arabinose transferase-like glycosyltransferase
MRAVQSILSKTDGDIEGKRLIKPVSLLIPLSFEAIGLDPRLGLQFQGLIFYFLAIILIAKITFYLYQNEAQVVFACLLFMSGPPIIFFGLSYLTDMGGWLFFILAIWLFLKYIKNKKIESKLLFLLGLIIGTGFLFKESSVAGLIFILFYLLITKGNLNIIKRAKLFIFLMLGGLLPILISTLIIGIFTRYTFLDWFIHNWRSSEKEYFNILNTFIQVGATFTIGWLYFLWGAVHEFREKNQHRAKVLLALLPSSICWLVWPSIATRFIYIASPLVSMVGSYGLMKIKGKLSVLPILLLLLYSALNFIGPMLLTLPKL